MDWKTTYQTWRDYADLDATLRMNCWQQRMKKR